MADSIKIGNLDISSFKVGSGDCTIYLGDTLLYPQNQHDYSQDYFTIVSEEDNNTISLKNTGYSTSTSSAGYWKSVVISASTDNGNTWSGFTTTRNSSKTLGTINKGQKMLLKGNATKFANTNSAYHYFDSTENFSVEGNTLSLFYGDNFLSYDSLPTISSKEKNRTQQLGCIFKGNTKIISAKNLILKPTTLRPRCYNSMFYGCTSLTTAPELPATTLENQCYESMFRGCTSLTTAPQLPATTLKLACYQTMFNGCTNLTTAPQLPATTLVQACYSGMFGGCTSLTTAPVLSATTLANYCYNNMFYGCASLDEIICLATDITAVNCTADWVNGVANSGTFYKSPSMNDWTTGVNGIPSGWAVQDYNE